MAVIGDGIRRRVGVAFLLVLVACSLLVLADIAAEECPTQQCVATDYERYVGSEVRFWGTVVSADPVTVHTTTEPPLQLRLEGIDRRVRPDTRLVFYGTVRPSRTVTVEEFVVHSPAKRQSVIAISIVAYPLLLLLWVRYWRVDGEEYLFRRRDD